MFSTHGKIVTVLTLLGVVFFSFQDRNQRAEAKGTPPIFSQPRLVRELDGSYSMIGLASWYSRNSPGINKRTANNELFDEKALTCAIWGAEFNRKVRVTNLKTGRSVVLRVNDRGPEGHYFLKGRVVDLTPAAFRRISDSKHGLIRVKVELL